MVRFKNRHILVEFLDPSSLAPFPDVSQSVPPPCPDDHPDFDDDNNGNDIDDELARVPDIPFMLPLVDGTIRPLIGDDGGAAIFKAVRGVVQEVFGDEGWGRVASSFKVIYHSPLTTLTIIRIARPHYRLLWGAISMLTAIGSTPVLPRVIAVSGTIKKLQSAAIVYHRRVTAAAVASLLTQGDKGEAEKEQLQGRWQRERDDLARLED